VIVHYNNCSNHGVGVWKGGGEGEALQTFPRRYAMLLLLLGLALACLVLHYLLWRGSDPLDLKPSEFLHPANPLPPPKPNTPTEEKILIVGAGFCGLAIAASFKVLELATAIATGHLLLYNIIYCPCIGILLAYHYFMNSANGQLPQRHGIAFESAEANDHIGGNWYNGVYDNVNIISSRKTTEYKVQSRQCSFLLVGLLFLSPSLPQDFPMPDTYPDFPSRDNMLKYFDDYAQEFDLLPHIRFNTKVSLIEPLPQKPDQVEQYYKVTFNNNNNSESKVYRGVVVANGHHWSKRVPSYPGNFTGV